MFAPIQNITAHQNDRIKKAMSKKTKQSLVHYLRGGGKGKRAEEDGMNRFHVFMA